jgi:hypothetical protein
MMEEGVKSEQMEAGEIWQHRLSGSFSLSCHDN